ncbi:MAG: HAD hydrolase-like protein [Chloroflexi bacterium]|nr:HAD hydrolase-like protein [Chloroflexota bacterium]MYD66223.1 HAD hydrolase-like protein [Chloroflexota bacterium]
MLFDIDGTLLDSDGAGRGALNRAYEEATGVSGAMDGVVFQGRTDRWILDEVARRTGATVDPATFLPRYYQIVEQELAEREPRALPGVPALLEALDARDDVVLGIGTGNLRRAAFLKLASVGLDGYFTGGGFGDDHLDRVGMLRDGAREIGWSEGDRLVVIGDTEHDITGGKAIGAYVLAVATGWTSLDDLARHEPDALLPNLSDRDGVVELLLAR